MSGLGDVKFIISPALAAFVDIKKASDRAAMWAVRESARQTGRAAKKHAPVKTGRYKNSIRSSKQLTRPHGDDWRVAVAPRGEIVHLYAQKVEANGSRAAGGTGRDSRGRFTSNGVQGTAGPMAQGFADVRGSIGAIHEKALAKALAKYL